MLKIYTQLRKERENLGVVVRHCRKMLFTVVCHSRWKLMGMALVGLVLCLPGFILLCKWRNVSYVMALFSYVSYVSKITIPYTALCIVIKSTS